VSKRYGESPDKEKKSVETVRRKPRQREKGCQRGARNASTKRKNGVKEVRGTPDNKEKGVREVRRTLRGSGKRRRRGARNAPREDERVSKRCGEIS